MSTILYTTTDAIRSCIGVDIYDVTDAIITGQNMAMQMEEELLTVYPGHATAPASLDNTLALWCMWFGALRLVESPLTAPKSITTGKDALTRFDADWDKLKNMCRAKLAKYQATLEAAAGTGATSTPRIVQVIPAYDPIAGPQE